MTQSPPSKKMSKLRLASLSVLIIFLILYPQQISVPPPQLSALMQPQVFFLAHQDDELFMAGAIRRAVNNAQSLAVVMVTDGGSSAVRRSLGLSRQKFSAARNREFFSSMLALGVSTSSIYFANPGGIEGSNNPLYKDDRLTIAQATEVIELYYRQFGSGHYYTLAGALGRLNAEHGDHRALRLALQQFKPVSNKYFFSENTNFGRPQFLTAEEKTAKQAALREYFVWSPRTGRYAIGAHSVPKLFERWSALDVEYVLGSDFND